MMNIRDLYWAIYPHALAAYARSNPDAESAKQMARALAGECAAECARLGIIEGAHEAPPRTYFPGVGAPGIPSFAQHGRPEGPGSPPMVPPGAPQQPVQHYNHVPQQQQQLPSGGQPGSPVAGGQQIFPPAGGGYEPPKQAGVMGAVTQAPTPTGYSALGTNGVILHPEQRPNGKDTVVAPGMQPMVPAVGGAGSTFVPERIVR
jgi:hypothetical protein